MRQEATDSSLYRGVVPRDLLAKGVYVSGDSLTAEQQFYLDILDTGYLPMSFAGFENGLPLRVDLVRAAGISLPSSLGIVPSPEFRAFWMSELLAEGLNEFFPDIAQDIVGARDGDYIGRIVRHRGTELHVEAVDYGQIDNLEQNFFQKKELGLTPRRIRMIADLAVFGLRQCIARNSSATLIDFGPGLFSLERAVLQRLSETERGQVSTAVCDVSEDLCRLGLMKSLADTAHVADLTKLSSMDLRSMFPVADVVVFAEILEHIDHSGAFFKEVVLPWLMTTRPFLVGSVPNAVQLPEFVPMITGTGSSHQLRRPIVDQTNDHHSHYTAATLAELLNSTWEFEKSGIISNGVRIQKNGNDAHLFAGLDYPQLGDRLIFWAQ